MSPPRNPSIKALRRAKARLHKKHGEKVWFLGVGIVPTKDGLGLRLNVDESVEVDEDEIPTTYRKIPIEIVRLRGYELREADEEE